MRIMIGSDDMTQQRSKAFDVGRSELELWEAMLNDKMANHELDTIIKEIRIIRLQNPEDVGKVPGIKLYMGRWRSARWGQNVDRNGTKADIIKKIIINEIYVHDNNEFDYFGVHYKKSEDGITVIRDIIYRIVSERYNYSNASIHGIKFDNIMPVGEVWISNFNRNPGLNCLQLSFEVDFEKEHL
jgi:hypothetical protein